MINCLNQNQFLINSFITIILTQSENESGKVRRFESDRDGCCKIMALRAQVKPLKIRDYMDYLQFASDLSLDKTHVFNSVEENEETMRRHGVTQEIRQLGKGKFRADLAVRNEHQVEFYSDRFNKALSARLETPENMTYLMFPRSVSGEFRICGKNVSENTMMVLPSGTVADMVVPDLAGSDTISISQTRSVLFLC